MLYLKYALRTTYSLAYRKVQKLQRTVIETNCLEVSLPCRCQVYISSIMYGLEKDLYR